MTICAAERERIGIEFANIASRAGVVVMEVYAGEEIKSWRKSDGSVVCAADERAEEVILAGLADLFPGVPVVAEESMARTGAVPMEMEIFILVDPVDGTKEFLRRSGQFTINIALIEGGIPVVGCIYAPAFGDMYVAGERAVHAGAFAPGELAAGAGFELMQAREAPADLTVVTSRLHSGARIEKFLSRLPIAERINAGSSLKFCMIADGRADIYPRFGTTMEWDTAAGQAILQAAGGEVRAMDGGPMLCNKREQGFRNSSFVAWGRDAYRRYGAMTVTPCDN